MTRAVLSERSFLGLGNRYRFTYWIDLGTNESHVISAYFYSFPQGFLRCLPAMVASKAFLRWSIITKSVPFTN